MAFGRRRKSTAARRQAKQADAGTTVQALPDVGNNVDPDAHAKALAAAKARKEAALQEKYAPKEEVVTPDRSVEDILTGTSADDKLNDPEWLRAQRIKLLDATNEYADLQRQARESDDPASFEAKLAQKAKWIERAQKELDSPFETDRQKEVVEGRS